MRKRLGTRDHCDASTDTRTSHSSAIDDLDQGIEQSIGVPNRHFGLGDRDPHNDIHRGKPTRLTE